jgi:hypothetical protein
MVWDWAVGLFEFPELVDRLATTFGPSFVAAKWSSTFNTIFNTSRPQSDDEQSLDALVDHGNAHPLVSAPIEAVEDAMKALGVSISASRMPVPPPQNCNGSNRRTSHRLTKCRKTASIFLDIFAEEGNADEDEDEDEDEVVVARSNLTTQVLPARHAHYNQDVQHIVACYEERQPSKTHSSLVLLEPHHLVLPKVQESVYILWISRQVCVLVFIKTIFLTRLPIFREHSELLSLDI